MALIKNILSNLKIWRTSDDFPSISECTDKALCGYGAECVNKSYTEKTVCQCKAGFRGQSRVGVEAQCSRIYN